MLISSHSQKSNRNVGLLVLAYMTLAVGCCMLLIGLHIYLATIVATPVAFMITGSVLRIISAVCLSVVHSRSKPKKETSSAPASVSAGNDPLAEYIPQDLLENPAVVQLLEKLRENPVSTTAMAFT